MARGTSQWFTARFDALDGPAVPTILTYRRSVPWEIEVRFLTGQNHGDGARWLMDRGLLTRGMGAPTGIGDVRVSPAGPMHLRLELHNGHTTAEGAAVYLRYTAVRSFLQATHRLVPPGTEHRFFDLDSICDALRRAA